jgi:hypothetical protein
MLRRFPFLANEIFNCEINALLDKFFDAPETVPRPKKEETSDAVTKPEEQKQEDEDVKMTSEDQVRMRRC